jgi:hypothetical protein
VRSGFTRATKRNISIFHAKQSAERRGRLSVNDMGGCRAAGSFGKQQAAAESQVRELRWLGKVDGGKTGFGWGFGGFGQCWSADWKLNEKAQLLTVLCCLI